jgi:flagellar motor switch protein FliN/FliY
MSDAARSIKPELQPWFDAWKTCTQDVLSQIAGQPQAFDLSLEPFAAADSDLRYLVAATGAVQGELAVRVPLVSGLRLAHKFLGEALAGPAPSADSAPADISNDNREALEELLRQVAGLAATVFGSLAGGEVRLQLSPGDAPWAATVDSVSTLRTRDESGTEIAIEVRIGPALAAALSLRAAATAPESTAAAVASTAPQVAPSSPAPPSEPPPNVAGYHRLFDVGLGVKLRFGTRRMLLRDVLALSSGLVVELDNALDSPVDLLLDGRVIARGEVVVIDGKYGLRVSEVVDSPPPAAAHGM